MKSFNRPLLALVLVAQSAGLASAQSTPMMPAPPLTRHDTPAITNQPDEIGRVRALRIYCTPVISNANIVIGKVQANDATLGLVMDKLTHADVDTVTNFARNRTVNQLSAYGASLQRSATDAQANLKKIRDAANNVEELKVRNTITDMAKALDASLDRQRKIGVDLVKAMVIYQGRLQAINAQDAVGSKQLLDEGWDTGNFTKLREIFPATMENDPLKQTATFDETLHEIGDEFADRITVINAFEGIASQYGDRATSGCFAPVASPAPSPAPTK